jgi:hypothetical protein
MSSNGHTIDHDTTLERLYGSLPTPTPALPEAAFSLSVRGRVGGNEATLTVRAMTPEAFRMNIAAIAGILDAAPATPASGPLAPGDPGSSPGQALEPIQGQVLPRCPDPNHGYLRKGKGGHLYCPTRLADGTWCKGGKL